MALLARGAIGDEAHGIDGLVSRPRCDERLAALKRALPSLRKNASIGGEDRLRLGHAAQAEFAARHVALVGPDGHDAVVDKACEIALRRGVMPHAHIHRGRDQTGLSVASSAVEARSSARPAAILAIRSAVAGATTTRSAARDNSMWPISASSVRLKRSVIDLVAGEARDRQRRDEVRAGLGEDGARARAPLAQAADQLEGLIGGDAAADDEQDAFVLKHAAPLNAAPLGREIS